MGRLPPALVLVGGLGTRLPEVSVHRPKPLADVGGRPFLEFVLRHLRACGVTEAILCTGHRAELIEAHFAAAPLPGLALRYVREPAPRGTAGALRLALPLIGARALALNGDSYAAVDLGALLAVHEAERALVTLSAVERADASRFGSLRIEGARLRGFAEKGVAGAGLINAGVYVIERAALESVPEGAPCSLEQDLLPRLLRDGAPVAVHRHEGYFEDIGVPEGLAAFRAAAPALLEREP